MLGPGVAPIQVQHLALGLVEPHGVPMGTFAESAEAPVDGILSLRCDNCTTQLGDICKFDKGALDPFVCVIEKILNKTGPRTDP